jgi:methyl-accepting chemotaxis protein
VTQIGGAMGQLSKATQQNASASEQLAATSEELSGQAGQLQQAVAIFGGGEAAAPSRPGSMQAERRQPNSPMRGARPAAAGKAVAGNARANGSTGNFRPY